MYEICEENSLTYTFGFSTNARLKTLTEGLMQRAVEEYEQTKQKAACLTALTYQCDSWSHARTVIPRPSATPEEPISALS